jgi:hypothetical protein
MLIKIVATVCVFLVFMAALALKAARNAKSSCCGGCAEPHECRNERKGARPRSGSETA